MKLFCSLIASGAIFIGNAFASGDEIVYDNSHTPVVDAEGTWTFNNSKLQYGDEITLAGHGRMVTAFYLEMFSSYTVTGDETARVRFYANDGPALANPASSPGTLLFQSDKVPLDPGYITISITDMAVPVPDSFTWTIEFGGLSADEPSGLLFYDPATVGSSEDDFWQQENGLWTLLTFPDQRSNFAARVVAVDIVPRIRVRSLSGGSIQLTSPATQGKSYSLEYRDAFRPESPWRQANVAPVVAGYQQVTFVAQLPPESRQRYYRIAERTTTLSASGNEFLIQSYAIFGKRYQLQASSDFAHWLPVGSSILAENSNISFSVANEGGARFYRVTQL
jgi:hypothetical protein